MIRTVFPKFDIDDRVSTPDGDGVVWGVWHNCHDFYIAVKIKTAAGETNKQYRQDLVQKVGPKFKKRKKLRIKPLKK